MASKKVRIVKVPLPPELKNKNIPQNFPNMPISYLELIENKNKIKPDFINKEYIPRQKTDKQQSSEKEESEDVGKSLSSFELEQRENSDDGKSPQLQFSNGEEDEEEEENNSMNQKSSQEDFEQEEEQEEEEEEEENNYMEKSVSRSSVSPKSNNKSETSERSGRSEFSERSKSRSLEKKKKNDKKLSKRLKELLNDSSEEKEEEEEEKQTHIPTHQAPSLKDLEKTGKFTRKKQIEDIGRTSLSAQEEEDAKRELIFKFDLLKKSYRSANVPEFTIHSDLNMMKKTYESTLRTLSLDKSVEDYKRYLVGGFMLMEFFCGNWLGFDMSGFTQQQMVSMNSYEKLLIELGEKSYVPSGSRWPVEVRLLFLVVMNAAFFIISKMIMKKTGSNLMNMMNTMNNAGNQNASSDTSNNASAVPPKKRKMKGPTVSVDDIPDVNDTESV